MALTAGFAYRTCRLPADGLCLGRDGGQCDLVASGAAVSRRHARIRADAAGRWLIEDLGSPNGVFVNGRRIDGAVALADGDTIGLGTAAGQLRLQLGETTASGPTLLPPKAAWVIGRADDSTLVLTDDYASTRHARLSPRGTDSRHRPRPSATPRSSRRTRARPRRSRRPRRRPRRRA